MMSNPSPGRNDKIFKGSYVSSSKVGNTPFRTKERNYMGDNYKNTELDSSSTYQVPQPASNQNTGSGGYTEFFSWGNDEDGQLGHGQEGEGRKRIFNLPKSLSFEVLIRQVSCGVAHTSFISKQGYVFSFGSNVDGQLGISDPSIKYSTAPLLVSEIVNLQVFPTQISCGGYHTGIVTQSGEAFLWGRNLQGQCGRPAAYNQFIFQPCQLHFDHRIYLTSIDCGDQHSAVISRSGVVFAFGDNSDGQVGFSIGEKSLIDRPVQVESISEEVVQVSCGYKHSLFLTENGKVYGCGSNKKSEMGLGNSTMNYQTRFLTPVRISSLEMYMISQVKAGYFSVAVTSQQELLVWGYVGSDLGSYQTPQKLYLEDIKVQEVGLSKQHDGFIIVVDSLGSLYSWGSNQFGQLGQGDFRGRNMPSKVNQLRKKKVRNVACGGSFVVALGRDVSEKEQQSKQRNQKYKHHTDLENPSSFRAKSQSQIGQTSFNHIRRDPQVNEDFIIQPKIMQEGENEQFNVRSKRPISQHQDYSQSRTPYQNSQTPCRNPQIQQPVSVYASQNYGAPQMGLEEMQNIERKSKEIGRMMEEELSQEKVKRRTLEKDVKDKEYELQNYRKQKQSMGLLEDELNQQVRENEKLRKGLEQEQDNSFKIINELQQANQEGKLLKDMNEEKNRELRQLKDENKRLVDKCREGEIELDKARKEHGYVVTRSEGDMKKLQDYLNECEGTIGELRERQRELERQMATTKDYGKGVEQQLDRSKLEGQDLKRQNEKMNEKIRQLEYVIQTQGKENEDLKYDNTLLYEKNVEKDEKLEQCAQQIQQLGQQLGVEKDRGMNLEKEVRLKNKQVQELSELLNQEADKVKQRDRNLEDQILQSEEMRRNYEDTLGQKNMDYDNLKRAFDEQAYENENLRRIITSKQDELGDLYQKLESAQALEDELRNKIEQLEALVIEVEEKNKKLVELLNSNIYNKAEAYKEKVLSKLQERNPNQTPNKFGSYPPQLSSSFDQKENAKFQPSPIRLQKILTDEKTQAQKERERLQRAADNLNRNQDQQVPGLGAQLSKSTGYPPSQLKTFHGPQFSEGDHQRSGTFTPYPQQREGSPSPTRANTTAGQSHPYGFDAQSRGRGTDLQTPNKYGADPRMQHSSKAFSELIQQQQQQQRNKDSPERVADILKQNSPLRKKVATETLQPYRSSSGMDLTPQRSQYQRDDEEQEKGSAQLAKITHTLMQGELNNLKYKYQEMQREKVELESRLNRYESTPMNPR